MVGGSKEKAHVFNAGEGKVMKDCIHDLSALATKQALLGLVQVLTFKANISRAMFEDVIDDARKYTEIKGVEV